MYTFFDPNEIRPTGWLRDQLEIQLNGLAGNLDKVWPDIRDSAWIGGTSEGWERVPYWLDGFIPLGFLLENEDAIARAKRYVDAILDRQKPDGWICPCADEEREKYDIWSLFLIGKVLALYCEWTHDDRAESGLYKAMKCMYDLLKAGKISIFRWGKFRTFECMIPLCYLYEQRHEEWILDAAKLVTAGGADYHEFTETWKRPMNKWTFHTHLVNLCMMFKYEAVTNYLIGGEYTNEAEKFWQILEKYNGTAVGTFTGDECLAGIGADHGTELCSVAELMYSCELLYAITGDPVWADRYEKAAFNALPATISDDMWTHQYDQMVNQIACIRFPGKTAFRSNSAESHLFGLEPHFGCCTANFGQAWPKFALSAFLRAKDGIRCASLLPAKLSTTVNGVGVTVENKTEYPFRLSCNFTVRAESPVEFTLYIRIPSWAKSVKVHGKTVDCKNEYAMHKVWNGETNFTFVLSDTPHLVSRPNRLNTVEYGPLVFALPIETEYKMREYERKGVERKFPYCDYELIPHSEWRYGFADDAFRAEETEGDGVPFSSTAPRIRITANLARVNWDFADGYDTLADRTPRSRIAIGAPEKKVLIPYGCAKLRMTEMPTVLKKKK